VLWKALLEHDPTKLDSVQNSISTENSDFPKIKYTQCHFNYYCKNTSPKIAKLVSQARYIDKLSLKIGFIHFSTYQTQDLQLSKNIG
jgi:hypothetical protein